MTTAHAEPKEPPAAGNEAGLLARARLGDEDAITVLQHLPEYQEQAPLATWLTRIAVNEGVGVLRRRRTQPIDLAEPDTPFGYVQWSGRHSESPEQIFASNEIQQVVRNCLDAMRPDYRAVLFFRILQEQSHEEIAQRLGLSVAAVKIRIHRARQVLQGRLRLRGIGIRAAAGPRSNREERD